MMETRKPKRIGSRPNLSVEPLLPDLLLVLVVAAAVLEVLSDEVPGLGGLDGAVVVVVQLLVQSPEDNRLRNENHFYGWIHFCGVYSHVDCNHPFK